MKEAIAKKVRKIRKVALAAQYKEEIQVHKNAPLTTVNTASSAPRSKTPARRPHSIPKQAASTQRKVKIARTGHRPSVQLPI
jgi:hypothetical protein